MEKGLKLINDKKTKKELMLNISGFKSLKIAKDLNLNSVKLHTTHFF